MSPPATSSTTHIPNSPLAPDLVLRVGFAGKRDFYPSIVGKPAPSSQEIDDLGVQIKALLIEVFACIGQQLIDLAPHTPCLKGTPPAIAAYYARKNPLLRVLTGLCEGADTLAFQAAEELALDCLEVEKAAVIGFPLQDYRSSRETSFLPEFDRQVSHSSYILVADGHYDPIRHDDPNASEQAKELAKKRRNRGYRCQSDLLLRQSDLLVALVDPNHEGKAGGTLETIRKALALQIPVVLINPAGLGIRILSAEENLADSIEAKADPDWKNKLPEWVTRIVANPSLSQDAFQNEQSSHGRVILEEFFSGKLPVPSPYEDGPRWENFVDWFRSEKPKPRPPAKPWEMPEPEAFRTDQAYKHYRNWASSLSAHYAERFRNAFFRNALFALAAVILAGLSLLVFAAGGQETATPHSTVGKPVPALHGTVENSTHSASHEKAHPTPHSAEKELSPFQIGLLIVLAIGKLVLVLKIFLSAHRANHDHWNDRVVDYRYLSERLRAMLYLPSVGSWQPPAAAPAQYASRVVRQSAVDWLADAIVRSISPGAWQTDAHHTICLQPEKALEKVKEDWLRSQLGYHEGVALRMQRMDRWLRSLGELLNLAVLVIVAFDIAFLLLKIPHWLPHFLVVATPYIVFVTAIIPAAVAAVNLIRLQSECERLAERSAVLVRLLGGRRDSDGNSSNSTQHVAHSPSGHGSSHDQVVAFLTAQWRKLRIVFDPRGNLIPPTHTPSAAPQGGKIRAAEDLLSHLATPEEAALGSHAGKVLHFTENCAEIFVQEVAEWSVLYAKELVEP